MKGPIHSATTSLTLLSGIIVGSSANGQAKRTMSAPPPVVQPAPPASQIGVAPAPVMRNPNGPQADYQSPQPAQQFTALSFVVRTGDDDLRTDSAAWLDMKFPDGSTQKCMIKNYDADSWGNGSAHDNDVPQCKLQQARTFDELKKTDVVLVYDGMTHDNAFEGADNWNVNEVRINALDIANHNYPCVLDVTGNPLVRLKLVSPDSSGFPQNESGSGSFDLTQAPSTC